MEKLGTIAFSVLATMTVLLAVWLACGKRQMGELTPLDFAGTIIIGTVAGAGIADPRIGLGHTLTALVCVGAVQVGLAWLSLKVRGIYNRMNHEPTVVVDDGQIIKGNLRHSRLTAEMLLQLLREKDVFDITEVELAILEPTGKLSVLKKAEHQPLTATRLGYAVAANRILLPVVLEGELQEKVLRGLGFSTAEIDKLRAEYESRLDEVFVAFMDKERRVHLVKEDAAENGKFFH